MDRRAIIATVRILHRKKRDSFMENQRVFSPERRKSYRMRFDTRRQGTVSLSLTENEMIEARLLDLNAGGLRCSLPGKTDILPQLHRYIKRIVVRARTLENPLVCSGIVRRVEMRRGARSPSVAMEFSAVLSGQYALQKDKFSANRDFSEHGFLMRLQDAKPFVRCRNKLEKQRLRTQLHHSFSDIANRLPAEEKWWFFHVLETLKNARKPDQKELVAEYLKLCRKSMEKNNAGEIIIDSLP